MATSVRPFQARGRHRGGPSCWVSARVELPAPGARIFQLAEAARQQVSLVDLALPVMTQLAQVTGETTLLTTLVGDQALAVRQVAAPQPIRLTFSPGVARPLHAGASAKIVFAYLPEVHREQLLRGGRFHRWTARTLTDPVRLRRELDQIRAQGYAVSKGGIR